MAARSLFIVYHCIAPAKQDVCRHLCHDLHSLLCHIAVFQTRNLPVDLIEADLLLIPGKRRPVYHARHGKFRVVHMAKIAPVRVQDPLRMVLTPIAAHSDNVPVRVLDQIDPLVPTAYPGAEILHSPRLCHGAAGINGLFRRIAPREAYGSLRQL